ncbi:MAG: hypothetical protein ABG776_07230 [Cyanobacteria bacterium J06555_13]
MKSSDSFQEGESITLPRLATSMGFICTQDTQKNWVISSKDNDTWFIRQQPGQEVERWLLASNGVPQILMQKQEAIAFLKRQQKLPPTDKTS